MWKSIISLDSFYFKYICYAHINYCRVNLAVNRGQWFCFYYRLICFPYIFPVALIRRKNSSIRRPATFQQPCISPSHKKKIPLFRRGHLTLHDVHNLTNSNLLQRIQYSENDEKQFDFLWKHRHTTEAIVRKRLALSQHDICRVRETSEWLNGYFNICVPVDVVVNGTKRCVLFRTSMSHRLVGIVDENMHQRRHNNQQQSSGLRSVY